jgi:histone acetyltransferase 1
MATLFDQWTASSKDSVFLNLTRNSEPLHEPFNPEFTHFAFGEEQVIIGYKKPRVDITFRSHDLKPAVRVSYAQKIKPDIAQVEKLMNLEAALQPFLPEDTFNGSADEEMTDEQSWTPPGRKIHSYRYDGENFEVWASTLDDEKTWTVVDNMKIMIPMFIETGTTTFLEKPDVSEEGLDRWSVFFLYQVDTSATQGSPYALAGLGSAYRFTCLFDPNGPRPPKDEPLSYPCRQRISQFLILQPYQGSCHGLNLYTTMCDAFRADPSVFEITVEDPNEAFDNIRDYCDLAKLYSDPEFKNLHPRTEPLERSLLKPKQRVPLNEILPPNIVTNLRKRHMLWKRQVERLVELHLLQQIPASNRSNARLMKKASPQAGKWDRAYYFWRLLVKTRVAKRNWDSLEQIDDQAERVAKIAQSVDSQAEGYQMLIDGFDRRVDEGLLPDPKSEAATGNGQTESHARKRKIVLDDSDEDGTASKRSVIEID